ncbi:17306_t:CDS:1, partial [Dentiscutata erythropus]
MNFPFNKDDLMLSYDPLDPKVQAVYKDLKEVVDNLVQPIHGNNVHLETKLVYYLERIDQIFNPKKRKCGDGDDDKDQSVLGSN